MTTLPLRYNLVTRAQLNPDLITLPKLIQGDRLLVTLRLFEPTEAGSTREIYPTIQDFQCTIGTGAKQTVEGEQIPFVWDPPTSGAWNLRTDAPLLSDAMGWDISAEDFAEIAAQVLPASAYLLCEASSGTAESDTIYLDVPYPEAEQLPVGTTITVDGYDYTVSAYDGSTITISDVGGLSTTFGLGTPIYAQDHILTVQTPADSTWIFRTASGAALPAGWGVGTINNLEPVSFVRTRTFTRSDVLYHEVRLIQSPLAVGTIPERLVPDPPSISEIKEGGSASSTDDIEINEVQALFIPADFAGTYTLTYDVRKTRVLGLEDGPAEIAEALNALWSDGEIRFAVTNPVLQTAYIEFIGPLADLPHDEIEVTVTSHPPGVLTFGIDLNTAELADALRASVQIAARLECSFEILRGTDPEDEDAIWDRYTLSQDCKIVREQNYAELAAQANIDWVRPPTRISYVPFTPDQIITGSQHYATTFGDGVLTEFAFAHNLSASALQISIFENESEGRQLIHGTDYTLTYGVDFSNEIVVTIDAGYGVPDAAALLIVITSAGPASAFQTHTHTIAQVVDLQDELDAIGARLAALEDLAPSGALARRLTATGSTLTIDIPEIIELAPPDRVPAGTDIEAVLKGSSALRPALLLPAIHDASAADLDTVIDDADDFAALLADHPGQVYLNDLGTLTIPGGSGIGSTTLLDGEFLGVHPQSLILYPVTRSASTSSYFPRAMERTLFILPVAGDMWAAGDRLEVVFSLSLALLGSTVKVGQGAQQRLVIEHGVSASDTTPGTPALNLASITWNATPILTQRILVTAIPIQHKFGAAIQRSASDVVTAEKLKYDSWTAAASAPSTGEFFLRARLIEWDNENAPADARGYLYRKFSQATAKLFT